MVVTMTAFATYASVALPNPGKKGILKKLDNDYFEIILGAFGAFGNGGWLYDEKSAISYMNNNPEFLELMANRRMRSEWGHPVRTPGMSDAEWFERVCTIMESNWSSHIRKIHLSSDTVKDEKGRPVIAIIGEVTPCGPHADKFRRCLENPDEDVNYSIRSFARRDFQAFRKHITKIINFDSVWNPGIKCTSKFNTPSLESASGVAEMLDSVEGQLMTEFNLDRIQVELESRTGLESFEHNQELVKIIHTLTTAPQKKIFTPYQF